MASAELLPIMNLKPPSHFRFGETLDGLRQIKYILEVFPHISLSGLLNSLMLVENTAQEGLPQLSILGFLEGLTLMEDTPLEGLPRLSLSGFLEGDEARLLGETMLERGKATVEQLGKLAGRHHANAMLDHQDEIPVEWRSYDLVFGGTIWQDCEGDCWVAYLRWHKCQWKLCFGFLSATGWSSDDRLVRVSQASYG